MQNPEDEGIEGRRLNETLPELTSANRNQWDYILQKENDNKNQFWQLTESNTL